MIVCKSKGIKVLKEKIDYFQKNKKRETGNNRKKKLREENWMKKKQKKLMKEELGITLIALIITVIVMLILAGVAINLTIGENGIFKKSDEGAKIYKNATNNEATSLNSADKEMGDLLNQYYSANKPGKPNSNGIYTENSTINGGTSEAFNPEIPKGFKPKDEGSAEWGDGTTSPTEEAVQAGLIIEDAEGNQFVWVAVDGIKVKLNRYSFAENGVGTEQGEDSIERCYEATSSNQGNTVAKDIDAFKTSVAEHGGYYIARYEASYGTDGKPNSKVSTGMPATDNGKEYAPTIEGQLWNNITQPDAATASRNMYDSSYGATSDLVNSYAWDTAIVFIERYSGDMLYARRSSFNETLANTGTNGDEKCHIHDMASNCEEWSTETSRHENGPCVYRGGMCGGSISYTSTRLSWFPPAAESNASFRAILYL